MRRHAQIKKDEENLTYAIKYIIPFFYFCILKIFQEITPILYSKTLKNNNLQI